MSSSGDGGDREGGIEITSEMFPTISRLRAMDENKTNAQLINTAILNLSEPAEIEEFGRELVGWYKMQRSDSKVDPAVLAGTNIGFVLGDVPDSRVRELWTSVLPQINVGIEAVLPTTDIEHFGSAIAQHFKKPKKQLTK